MTLEELYLEITSDVLLIIIVVSILWYTLKKEEMRQINADNRYEELLISITGSTKAYADTLINIIDGLPNRQMQMLDAVSNQHLESVKLIVGELKTITQKLDRSYELNDEFIEYIRKRERDECEKRLNVITKK